MNPNKEYKIAVLLETCEKKCCAYLEVTNLTAPEPMTAECLHRTLHELVSKIAKNCQPSDSIPDIVNKLSIGKLSEFGQSQHKTDTSGMH